MDTIRQMLCSTLVNDSADWSALTPADWRSLLPAAESDGLLPLLCWRLNQRGWPPQMPPDLRRSIQLGYYSAVAQSGLIYSELERILAALAPITAAVVLKGAALGPTLYPTPALRPLSDIDLLVPERDLPAATAALQRLGYVEMPELTPGINQVVEYHTRLQGGPNRGVTVELHWRLVAGAADWRSPSHDWLWQQIEPWQPNDGKSAEQSAWQLSPTAELLYLAAHLILQHGSTRSRLIWLYDLHLLLTRQADRIHWQQAIERAREFRWAGALHAALLATRRYFGTALPPSILAALEAQADRSAEEFAQNKASAAGSATIGEWLKLQSLEPQARLRFIASLICPSPGYIRWRYQPRPRLIWPLVYPLHWLRIALAALYVARHLARQRLLRTVRE